MAGTTGYLTIDVRGVRSIVRARLRRRCATRWPTIRCSASKRSPRLADRLPPDQCAASAATCRSTTAATSTSGAGPPSATVLGIESNGFRVSLREIQSDPEYGRLIASCHDGDRVAARHP